MGEKKNNFGLGILIGLLIAIILGLVGFIVYDKVIANRDNSVEKETNEFVDIDVHSSVVTSAMNLLGNKEGSDSLSWCSVINQIYENYYTGVYYGKLTIDNFNDNMIMTLIYDNLSYKCDYFKDLDDVCSINESDFINSAKKVFGSKYKIPESGERFCSRKINYDKNEKVYKVKQALGGDESATVAVNNFVSAKISDDTLVVVENVKISSPNDNDVYEEKATMMLEYTFKKDLTTGFYFYSIEKK